MKTLLENLPDEKDDHNNVDEQTRAVSGKSLLTTSKTDSNTCA
jgi:hypothetical protein